jgi:MarR-like DNA-binding transcriptional regulator SgrR of sgrS sRNA
MKANHRKSQTARRPGVHKRREVATIRQTDHKVFSYLNKLCGDKEDKTCTVSLPAIAAACDISERQAQVSTGRLIEAGLLKRTGYDFGNAVRSRRGTKYRLLKTYAEVHYEIEAEKIESAIQMLLKRQATIESRLEQLAAKQDRMLSLVTRLAGQSANGKSSKRSSKRH